MSTRAEMPISADRLLWISGIVVAASLPHWLHVPFWVPILLAASIVWRLAVQQLGWPMPKTVPRLAIAFAAFAAVLAEYGTINGIDPGSALLVVMIALKFLETNSHRDQLVLIIISYFLVFASLLYGQSVAIAAYLMGFVWVATVGLLQLGRSGALLPARAFAGLAARLLLQALPIMVVMFLLFPRLPGPIWAIGGSSSSATTGLSDSMSPGDITRLALSDEVAFRVEFIGAPPPADKLYWRGPVLGEFDGRTWSSGHDVRRWLPSEPIEYGGRPTRYRVMLERQRGRWLLALDMPKEWSGLDNMRLGGDYQLRLGFGPPSPRRLTYEVTSYTDYKARDRLSAFEQRSYTYLPKDSNPRTRALAAGWQTAGSPQEIVDRALDFFRSHDFFYTLTPPALGENATDEFLFDTRQGFCEHYASAFAVMMRAAGVPARVVTGYQGGELNSVGGYYIVSEADAHAWTEVWLGDRGWVRVDPVAAVAPARIRLGSPRGALEGATEPGTALERIGWIHRTMLVWDAANTYWNDWIIGYGPRLQIAFVRALGIAEPDWGKMALLAAGATFVLLTGLGIYLSWTQRRGRAADAAARAFARFSRRLARRGIAPRRPTEAPGAFAARAAAAAPDAAETIRAVVATYLAARYEPDGDGEALRRLRRLVRESP